jgi:hypothetical protein
MGHFSACLAICYLFYSPNFARLPRICLRFRFKNGRSRSNALVGEPGARDRGLRAAIDDAAGSDARVGANCDILLCRDGCDFGAAIVEDGSNVGGANES